MKLWARQKTETRPAAKYPGVRAALDGSGAVVAMETAASEAAGAYPITPATQMGEGWAAAVNEGRRNVFGKPLIFFEPEGEHAAAGVTAGLSMTGLRATNFSAGQGIAYMHESLYAAAGKRLPYVLHMACRAMTKQALNVHAGHDDYHAVDDTGFFQMFAPDVQSAADLTLIARRIAELSLTPGICAQDGFLTSHVIESLQLPEAELIREYLGDPSDLIDCPTPAQRLVFGAQRRRVPEPFDLDYPAMLGVVQNQDSYAQGVAAQRPFFFDHVAELADRAFAEFEALTGRRYARAAGYRLEDAEYVIVGQGSVVANAQAACDHLRATRKLAVGVLDLTMFRPFPADLVVRLLAGKKGVTVLERLDQPLAADPPLLREIRAAFSQASENGRTRGAVAHSKLPTLRAEQVPQFYSGCFGLGSRDLHAGHLIAAVENMQSTTGRRRYYLGLDFVRKATRLPKLQIWQERIVDAYPEVSDLALEPAEVPNLLPDKSLSVRIHSVGGWGAITMGKSLALTAFELFGLHVKANPRYGSEKKGQPTTFYATLAPEPVRLNCELRHVDVVLSPDPNVFRHSDPLEGLADEGVFVVQSDQTPEAFFASLPARARRTIRERGIRLYTLDAFRIAAEEASDADLRHRMQGTVFLGAFFATSPLLKQKDMSAERLFDSVGEQLQKKFGGRGEKVVADNLRVIRRGFDEVRPVESTAPDASDGAPRPVPAIPSLLDVRAAKEGAGNPGRFWEQTCFPHLSGQDGIADPFAALSIIPAATGAIRDMTGIRQEVPEFIAANCTGCAQCWTQCPDAAIPGLVTGVDELLSTAIAQAGNGRSLDRARQASKHLARELQRLLKADTFTSFGDAFGSAAEAVVAKLGWEGERRAELEAELAQMRAVLADFPLAKTGPFFDVPESKEKGTGGLLSITVNPQACKGCNLCVEVCPDGALVTVPQNEAVVEKLRRNWTFWEALPDTPERYVKISDLDQGIGVLSSLLLKKGNYRSIVGGDGACMGCGEKTAAHLVVSAVQAMMGPRVARHVAHLDELITGLEARARELVAAGADLDAASRAREGSVPVAIDAARREEIERLTKTRHTLEDLRWRYVEGPGGRGRATLGISNATGCSSVWASTYPYNPYPFPWVNHLFQDAPSVAIGLFEGHMRKMAEGFAAVRRAQQLLSGEYDAAGEVALSGLEWKQFTDEEFALCPPILAIGGDGAMLDIGLQNLSRLLASDKPIRVLVLDTQVYSNTGGQACTSGFTGQISDMATYGAAHQGKTEHRKELALIAMAHRGAFVHQSSQASPSHMLGGVLKGLQSRRPAVFNIYTPCPVEHGLADDQALKAARLALESRAFPFLTFDPDAGTNFADCLSLEGNPGLDERWPTYALEYVDDEGATRTMELPLTVADWAATEGRFNRHFSPVGGEEELVPFHEFLALSPEDRAGSTPFVYVLGADRRLQRLRASHAIVELAEDRQQFWSQLRQLAGLELAPSVRERVADEMEAGFEARLNALSEEYAAKVADLKARYPQLVARRLAEVLLRALGANVPVDDLLASMPGAAAMEGVPSAAVIAQASSGGAASSAVATSPFTTPAARPAATGNGASKPNGSVAAKAADPAPAPAAKPEPEEDDLGMDPYIESPRCTSCNECTNMNSKLFAYDENKQAYIKDAKAGTFQQLVLAAEKCPVGIIHPGSPLNPKEKNLDKWIARAAPFN